MATLGEIEQLTKEYADARDRLGNTLRELNDKREALTRQYLPGIKKQVGIAAEKKLNLRNAIEEGKGLFVKPRTIIVHGIEVGFRKGKGAIEWAKDEADRIVKAIEKYFPELADVLIKTTKKPRKKALSGLSAAELKRLGITISAAGDSVVIEPTDSQIEQWVEKLLAEKNEEKTEEEAA